MVTKNPTTLDEVKGDISKAGQKVTTVNVLFLDVSSTCTGYSIMSVDFENKSASIKEAGALWLNNKKWTDQERYGYVFHVICDFFWIVKGIDYIVTEQYSINPKKMVGVQVLPELSGVLKAAAEENGVQVSSILPQTWRAQLGIKPVLGTNTKGKTTRDYKTPVKDYIENIYQVPTKCISNITEKERATPSDLYDAMAIGLGWCEKFGLKAKPGPVKYNDHIGYKLGE